MMIEPGLLYKDIEEGTGVIPQPGQKIKAHCKCSTEYSPSVNTLLASPFACLGAISVKERPRKPVKTM
jgi:hypothetical protein